MSENESPLPKPPAGPFEKKRFFEEKDEYAPLMADRLAAAMAGGTLDEFMRQELPDNEHARTLAMMMMGMSGMMPPQELPSGQDGEPRGHPGHSSEPPEEVVKAVKEGDVRGLMEILQREHKRRSSAQGEDITPGNSEEVSPALGKVEKEILDQLINIASGNNLSMDWIVLRALRLYVEEYQKTGRL
ncbi:MAG TPA: hypothetical protein VEI28_06100 [Thermodesulfovibrionales bacterium]|nr:hypothetical protein [Thermodesulfovibrionales bacterium]